MGELDRGGPTPVEAVRRQRRAARRHKVGSERSSAEEAAVELLCSLPELGAAPAPGRRPEQTVGWYLPIDGELDPGGAAGRLRARGWTLLLPVVGADRDMSFVRWEPGDELIENRFGIAEPARSDRPRLAASDLDVVLVPCVAVDPAGNRLGFGAGFYDRALAGTDAVRIGLAFEVQVVDRLEPEPWDVPLDVIVTEERTLRPDANDPG